MPLPEIVECRDGIDPVARRLLRSGDALIDVARSLMGREGQLHADVEILNGAPPTGDWALQLWACDAPHTGGPLTGIKVVEAQLTADADAGDNARRLNAEAPARVPGGQRDYAMVLVLASGDGDLDNPVHDFANYPARQRFLTPHFEGSVGYQIEGERVVLEADTIYNPRDADNISGSLSIELWALPQPYRGGTVEGHALGRAELGRLPGQTSIHALAKEVPFSPPPAGSWEVVLMLREWAGAAGYVTRDYAGFAAGCVVAETTPVTTAVTTPRRQRRNRWRCACPHRLVTRGLLACPSTEPA